MAGVCGDSPLQSNAESESTNDEHNIEDWELNWQLSSSSDSDHSIDITDWDSHDDVNRDSRNIQVFGCLTETFWELTF